MDKKSAIIEIVYQIIDTINEEENLNIPKDNQAKLFGRGGNLDSLGLVNLIVSVEEKINNKFGVAISLVDEKAMSQKNSPFLNIDSLSSYILLLIAESK